MIGKKIKAKAGPQTLDPQTLGNRADRLAALSIAALSIAAQSIAPFVAPFTVLLNFHAAHHNPQFENCNP